MNYSLEAKFNASAAILKGYAEKYYTQLTEEERAKLSLTRQAYESEHFLVNKDGWFHERNDEKTSSPAYMKAFLFAENLSARSTIHMVALRLLHGDELQHYLNRFIKNWKEDKETFEEDWGDGKMSYCIPYEVDRLLDNNTFTVEYAEIFLNPADVDRDSKSFFIRKWEESIRNNRADGFFNTDEINLILKTGKEHQTDITPVMESLRNKLDLVGVPDDWLIEAYTE